MKKTIAILLVLAVVMTGVFAATSAVTLNASIATVGYTASVYYDDVAINQSADIFSDGLTGSTKWDLASTTPITTEVFAVKVSGNENLAKTLKVSVTPENFKATVGTVPFDSEVRVTATATTGTLGDGGNTIAAGLRQDDVLCEWTLSWTGNASLPAAEYVSNVTIAYAVE